MTCDVYVLENTCTDLWVYPPQVHPPTPDTGGGGGVRPGLKPFVPPRETKAVTRKKKRHHDTDEDILAVLGLL